MLFRSSPGGSVYHGLFIYDTIQSLRCDVATYACGLTASMGTVLLSAGSHGKRFSLPNARILIHQTSSGFRGTAPDIEVQARETLLLNNRLIEIMSLHTGQPFDVVKHDTERDKYMSAEEAKDYGLVDHVLESPKLQALRELRASQNGNASPSSSDR